MLSWLRTPVAIEWLADCWFNTQSQLICIIIALHHPEPACNDDTCQPGHALQDFHYWKRRTLGLVDVHDNNNLESLMSSDVNNDRLLTTDKVVLFNAVDCSWYNNADGTDLQRPMRMTLGIGTLAAMAIVGPDNRIDCVLNHSSLSPNEKPTILRLFECRNITNTSIYGKLEMTRRGPYLIEKSALTRGRPNEQMAQDWVVDATIESLFVVVDATIKN